MYSYVRYIKTIAIQDLRVHILVHVYIYEIIFIIRSKNYEDM